MKSKLEKLEKKCRKEYTNDDTLNAAGNKYLRKVAEEVRENLSALHVQSPDLVDIAKDKWSKFKKIIDEAYNAVKMEIDSSGEVKLEDELNLPPPEWEKEFDEPDFGIPIDEDPFIKEFEEGF